MDRLDNALVRRQLGYFSARQARQMGFSRATLSYRSKIGTVERVKRGVYRLPTEPTPDVGHILASYLDVDRAAPTVSHESALQLLGVLESRRSKVHISVLRKFRNLNRPDIRLHTLSRPIPAGDRVSIHGIRATTPTRSILESVDWTIQPDELRLAIARGHQMGLIGSELGRRSVALPRAELVRQVWDAMPAGLLNETISYFIGVIAKGWRVGAILLDPPLGSDRFHTIWRLIVEVDPDVVPYVRDEYRDYLSYEVDWPLTNAPFFEVEVVNRSEWSGKELVTARRLA